MTSLLFYIFFLLGAAAAASSILLSAFGQPVASQVLFALSVVATVCVVYVACSSSVRGEIKSPIVD